MHAVILYYVCSFVDKKIVQYSPNYTEGVASLKGYSESTFDCVGFEDEVTVKECNKNSKMSRKTGVEEQQNSLMSTQERRDEPIRENDQNTEERQKDDRDYEDPHEDNEEHVYFVLEGPTPKREEGDMKDDGEQPINEDTKYDYPTALAIHKK